MKIKLNGRFVTPTINAAPGDIIDVPEALGNQLISNGGAELIEEVIEVKFKPKVIETASLDKTMEKAVKPKPVRKKK